MGFYRYRGPVVVGLVVCLLMGVLAAPLGRTAAQDDERFEPWWDDAPLVPRFRSQADWLIDAGWQSVAETFGPFATHEYEVGEEERFAPLGFRLGRSQPFVLAHRSEHAYFWFTPGIPYDEDELRAAADFFEEQIYPLNRSIYGYEWRPGIDGDDRLHILNQPVIDVGIVGAFNPRDQCPSSVCPGSNQRELIYIALDLAPLNSVEYLTTLAHEHQHLIQYHVDGNEARWLNEGLSQLAEHFNGFGPDFIAGRNLDNFLEAPDLPLHGWTLNPFNLGAYYGAGYLFMVYLYEQFGLGYIRHLAHNDHDGLAAVQSSLRATGQDRSIDQVFADWIIANLLDDPYVGGGRYFYQTLDLPLRAAALPINVSGSPHPATVNQYGADYYRVRRPGLYRLAFDGSDTVTVNGIEPVSEHWMWWSNNYSNSAARLTGAFDLAGLETATLVFSAWWDIELEYDWFQVLVSSNGGRDWELVGGDRSASLGMSAPGIYYSGQSRGWVEERVDLSAYVNEQVLVRFEYLTDASRSLGGLALDDIQIVELGYLDDAERDDSVWNPEGFLRVPALLTQNWTVAVVEHGDAGPARVMRLPLDTLHRGQTVFAVPEAGRTTIVVGAMAPFTLDLAHYDLSVERLTP